MPPKDNREWKYFFEDGTPVRIVELPQIQNEQEYIEDHIREFMLSCRIPIGRKKLSRNSNYWRVLAICGVKYRECRRFNRRIEKARREALKRRLTDGEAANVG